MMRERDSSGRMAEEPSGRDRQKDPMEVFEGLMKEVIMDQYWASLPQEN